MALTHGRHGLTAHPHPDLCESELAVRRQLVHAPDKIRRFRLLSVAQFKRARCSCPEGLGLVLVPQQQQASVWPVRVPQLISLDVYLVLSGASRLISSINTCSAVILPPVDLLSEVGRYPTREGHLLY